MKYQRTRKAVLKALVHLLGKTPATFGGTFLKWCLKQIAVDYPLFHWALKKRL